ncbi:Alpha/Beta hydrolase protein [Limtongia smithiae]|uniref:Alpha/Beta hydrolase protein n=1 Tax=Limtongia smithiae TaxID=1125753 RepID=UPI0034CEB0EF
MTRSLVQISTGLVQGVLSEYDSSIVVYKGLPYAASTAGENRWRAPQPPVPWEGVRIADTFGPPCPQMAFGPMNILPTQSEDCLSLNIWTPAGSENDKLPVFVWIYGGRFIAGSGSELAYDGTGLASKGIIVVTLNYRVGILGFLATPELSEESGHNASGNYGILDQIAALKWVQENIAAFGGDPSKVTIGGQSAGAASTALQTISPLSRGLFRAAIPQSGWRYPRDPLLSGLAPAYRTKEKAESQGVATVKEKGASSIAEMRKLPLKVLLEGNNKNDEVWGNPPFYRPCIDGWVFPYSYEECLDRGILADVPVMTGHNADEGGTYADPEFTEDDLKSCAKQKYGPLAEQFLKLYPVTDTIDAREAWNQAARDNSRVTVALWADEYHKHAKSPVFGYFYTHAPPPRQGGPDAPPSRVAVGAAGPDSQPKLRIYEKDVPRSEYTYSKVGPGARYGAFHGAEISYVLNNLYAQVGYDYGDNDRKVAATMSSYWANFIKYGNPNGEGLADFTPIDDGKIMSLGKECYSVPLAESPERIAFCKEYLFSQKSW